MVTDSGTTYSGVHLEISPGECLHFDVADASKDTLDILTLTNAGGGKVVAFKIKTTAPEKFKVKPSIGIIKPGSHAEVAIYLTKGEYDIALEKFLVCSMYLDTIPKTNEQLAQLWSVAKEETISGHILKTKHTTSSPRSELDFLINTNRKLQQKLTRIHLIQLTVLIALSILFLGVIFDIIPNPFGARRTEVPSDPFFPIKFP